MRLSTLLHHNGRRFLESHAIKLMLKATELLPVIFPELRIQVYIVSLYSCLLNEINKYL